MADLFTIPNFLNLKDRAIWGTAKGNLMVLRTSLAAYATDSNSNKYPIGTFDYSQISTTVPKANLPATEKLSKFRSGSFTYSCLDGVLYTINVNVDDRAYDLLVASPLGISPNSYEAYVR